MSNLQFDPFADTIPLVEGETLTTNWRNFISSITPSKNYIRAFYIPITDIDNLATYHNAVAVRAYLCLAVPDDPTTAKVVLVPVDSNNNDITQVVTPDGLTHSTVYDMTQPCPQMCDTNSPLY